MSRFSRMAIAAFALLGAGGLIAMQMSMPPEAAMNGGVLWTLIGFLILIAVACFEGPLRGIAARIIGTVIFVGCLGYFISELRNPTPVSTTHPNTQSLFGSVKALLVFGLPGAYVALTGRLPNWSRLRTSQNEGGNTRGRRFRGG